MKIFLKIKKIFSNSFFQIILLLSVLFLIFTYKLGAIPFGLFCDEAAIGYRAYEISQGKFNNLYNPFFYKHFNSACGSLPIYTTLPFVFLGLSDFSVRLASVVFSLLSLLAIYLILSEFSINNKFFPVLFWAFTPLFFHLSRINFGHTPSLFFSLFGFYLYLLAKKNHKISFAILGGIFFGLSFYGYLGYFVSNLLFLAVFLFSELAGIKFNLKKIKYLTCFLLIIITLLIPTLFFNLNHSEFIKRLKDKNLGQPQLLSIQKLKTMAENYTKYYSYDYLFKKGEIDLPGAFITRHSIRGNGILLKISLPLIILSLIFFIFDKKRKKWFFLPFFFLLFLYPIPDLITTRKESPPYSFSLFTTIFFLPFLIAYAIDFIDQFLSKKKYFRFKTILLIIIYSCFLLEVLNFLKNYQHYPLYSSDYWGWQYGPSEIIEYFKKVKNNYDELYLTGYFNEPEIFYSFYDPKHECDNCFVGGIDNLNLQKRQLFALRTAELPEITKIKPDLNFNSILQIFLPDGKVEYVVGYFNPLKK